MDARGLIQQTLGEPVRTMVPLEGGCVARVWRVRTETGRDLIAKCATDDSDGGFVDEAAMLDRLRRVAPTPEVIASRHGLLLMEYVEHDGAASTAGERELGGIVA
ncbi:MAG: phosphotransferase, partial [Planctomycetota bacterium]